ncbi:hypothetical protein [Paenibacillus tengchongensis]|uniref:hypothetical protein n=1 Tax=Paenibacillus tengchongensis TaxID=2608684 RepID=UPI00124E92FE|nr:hypothetical protein [Paenibacillus tengchongensis]
MSVDDYLDLLNYAKAIQDEQWQADIIEKLKNYNALTENTKWDDMHRLWTRFDQVNRTLLELFERLREEEDNEDSGQWKEQIWELKLERITLAKQIQERYIKIK